MTDQPPIVRQPSGGLSLGVSAAVIGFVGIFVLSFVLSPIALILGVLAIFRFQIFTGLLAILFALIGIVTSAVLMGLAGLSALVIIGASSV